MIALFVASYSEQQFCKIMREALGLNFPSNQLPRRSLLFMYMKGNFVGWFGIILPHNPGRRSSAPYLGEAEAVRRSRLLLRPGFGNINTRIMMNRSKRKYLSRRLISKLLKEIKSRIVTIQGS